MIQHDLTGQWQMRENDDGQHGCLLTLRGQSLALCWKTVKSMIRITAQMNTKSEK